MHTCCYIFSLSLSLSADDKAYVMLLLLLVVVGGKAKKRPCYLTTTVPEIIVYVTFSTRLNLHWDPPPLRFFLLNNNFVWNVEDSRKRSLPVFVFPSSHPFPSNAHSVETIKTQRALVVLYIFFCIGFTRFPPSTQNMSSKIVMPNVCTNRGQT